MKLFLVIAIIAATSLFLHVAAVGVTPEEVQNLLQDAEAVWQEANEVMNSACSLQALTDQEEELQRILTDIRVMRVRLDRIPGPEQTQSVHGLKVEFRRLEETSSKTLEECRKQLADAAQPNPPAVEATGGRPRYVIDPGALRECFEAGVAFNVAARIQGVSESTLYRRRRELGLLQRARHTDITDADLDNRMTNILRLDPNCGTLMAMGALRSQGISLPQARVYESLRRVAGADRLTARWQTPVERQPYETRCPNWVWHVDSYHKLNAHPRRAGRSAVCFGIAIQGGVDGYSKTCTFLSAAGYNTAEQMKRCFLQGVREFGFPSRIRTDNGGENNAIGQLMLDLRGEGHNAHLKGSSVRNVRIERFWGIVGPHYTKEFKKLFERFEREGILDTLSDLDIFALHFVYLPRINQALVRGKNWWNHHPIRTSHYWSPNQLRLTGYQLYRHSGYTSVNEHFNGPPIDVETLIEHEGDEDCLIRICRKGELEIQQECIEELFAEVRPFELENGNGMDKFLLAKEIIRQYQRRDD